MFVPLLLYARQKGWDSGYIDRLLDTLGLQDIGIHPGFRLHVQTLGNFRVWRGREAIPTNGWRREISASAVPVVHLAPSCAIGP